MLFNFFDQIFGIEIKAYVSRMQSKIRIVGIVMRHEINSVYKGYVFILVRNIGNDLCNFQKAVITFGIFSDVSPYGGYGKYF